VVAVRGAGHGARLGWIQGLCGFAQLTDVLGMAALGTPRDDLVLFRSEPPPAGPPDQLAGWQQSHPGQPTVPLATSADRAGSEARPGQHRSPRQAPRPSRTAAAAMTSPVTGSAHRQPNALLKPSPTRSTADK
jgi:hypothetical protein